MALVGSAATPLPSRVASASALAFAQVEGTVNGWVQGEVGGWSCTWMSGRALGCEKLLRVVAHYYCPLHIPLSLTVLSNCAS